MKILICPADWGLGHAARCAPVIRELRARGYDIVIGASGRSQEFLVRQFPDLECLEFSGISPRYPVDKRFAFYYLAKIPTFLFRIFLEHCRLRRLISARRFGMVVSDSRIGLFTRLCPSVLITHQLFLKCPAWKIAGISWGRWVEKVVYLFLWFFFRRFDQIWVPDFASPPYLSGELAHRKTRLRNVRFIGPLCRFSPVSLQEEAPPVIDRLALISGPEPQRTIFEVKTKALLKGLPGRNVMVLGKPEEVGRGGHSIPLEEKKIGLFVYPHADEETLRSLIRAARLVITRPGYTTVMELAFLEVRNVLFVPTPGQTEQEYLARYFEERGVAPWRNQRDMNREDLRFGAARYRGFGDFLGPEHPGRTSPLRPL